MTLRPARALVLAALLVPAGTRAACPSATSVTELGIRRFDEQQLVGTKNTATVGEPARHVRVLVAVSGVAPAPWILVVRDAKQRVVQVLRNSDFMMQSERWTVRVSGGIAQFDLYAPPTDTLRIRLRDYILMPEGAAHPLYSARDPSAPAYRFLYEASVDASTRRLGDAVGLLTSSFGQTSWCCSGVLIAPDLFLTNWHCGAPTVDHPEEVWSRTVCSNSFVDMSWDDDPSAPDDRAREYRCTAVVESDRALDFAILRLAPVTAEPLYDRPAVVAADPPDPGPVRIIHHPTCLPKRVTTDCVLLQGNSPNWVDPAAASDALHDCDTERGSSGAPVFDADGRVTALHHRGYELDDTCHPTAYENRAVRLQDILHALRAKNSPVVRRMVIR